MLFQYFNKFHEDDHIFCRQFPSHSVNVNSLKHILCVPINSWILKPPLGFFPNSNTVKDNFPGMTHM